MKTNLSLPKGLSGGGVTRSIKRVAAILVALLWLATHAEAFSLIGPFADWKLGPMAYTRQPPSAYAGADAIIGGTYWGSFDNSTNPPVVYPCGVAQEKDSLAVRFRLYTDPPMSIQAAQCTWEIPVRTGSNAVLQASTNLVDWVPSGVITNQGAIVEWQHVFSELDPKRFFRVVPQ